MKCDFRSEMFIRKFGTFCFFFNVMTGCCLENGESYQKKDLGQWNKETQMKS